MKRNGILIKSDRAIQAEKRGLVVYSRLKAWQKRAVDKGVVEAAEWHHTSGAANRTNYYDPKDFEHLDSNNFKAIKKSKATQPELEKLTIKITFDKCVGGFASRRKRYEEITVEGLDIRKSDNVIIGAGGRRLDSNNKRTQFFIKDKNGLKELTKSECRELGYKLI